MTKPVLNPSSPPGSAQTDTFRTAAKQKPEFEPHPPSGPPPGAQAASANPKATTAQILKANPKASIKLPERLVWPIPWSEQNSLAQDDGDQQTQNSQQTHYANSQAGASESVYPSPSSVGETVLPVTALGGWNPRVAPHPVMFDAGIHEREQFSQLEDHVLQQHGATKYRDVSRHAPVCLSGHNLNPVQILEISSSHSSPRGTTYSCCQKGFEVRSYAFTCYRCVAAYYFCLPIDKEVASAGLSKGTLYCPKCAFLSISGDVQVGPVITT